MKISFYLPSLRGGGAERMYLHLANAFVKKKFEVDLILTKAEGPYLSNVSDNVNIIDFDKSRVLFSLPDLVKYFQSNKPNVLFSAMNHANLVVLASHLLSFQKDVRIYVGIRNTIGKTLDIQGKKKLFYLKLMKQLYSRADGIITVSNGVADDFKKNLGLNLESVKTIYNPVINDDLLNKAEEEVAHPWFQSDTPPVILGCGRLTEQKDFGSLIKAFSIVDEKKESRLVILGEGQERNKLKKLVSDLGLTGKVDLPGFVNNPFKYMKQTDVFVLSSRWEGLPGVLIQAMACGASVVSTDCPSGPREILMNGKYGKLVPVGDTEKLADEILKTLENKQTEPDRGLERFEEKKVMKQYLELVEN